MLDLVLRRQKLSVKITVKATIAVLLAALAVALPQLTHALGGAQAGAIYMPMYFPALLAGIMLGRWWGLGVGLVSPLISYGFTSLTLSSAMPALERLPYMILEVGAFGFVSGLFSERAQKSPLIAFPAVLTAEFSGRLIYVIYNLIAGKSISYLWNSVVTGMTGLWLQAIIAPLAAILLFAVLKNEQKSE